MSDASDYITDLRRRGFRVYISEEGLHVTPRRNLDERDLDAIRQNKWEMMAELWQTEANRANRQGEDHLKLGEDLADKLYATERALKSAETLRNLYRLQADMAMLTANELRADAMRRRPADELDDGILRQALYLVHPDKHGGSEVFVALQRIKERRWARP